MLLMCILVMAIGVTCQEAEDNQQWIPPERVIGFGADKFSPALRIRDGDRKVPARNRTEWTMWKNTYGGTYANSTDEELHARVFEETERIVASNKLAYEAGRCTYVLGINKFAAMIELELEQYTGVPPNNMDQMETWRQNMEKQNVASEPSSPISIDAASSLDLRNLLPPVKNQLSCGSCYTFSAMSVIEARVAKNTGKVVNLSEQYPLDCTYLGEYGNNGCGGGWMWNIFRFFTDNRRGVLSSVQYPYEAKVNPCKPSNDSDIFLNGHVIIPKGNEDAIGNALQMSGPIAIAYNAGTPAHAAYTGGILDVPNCGNQPTHADSIVGFGTENGKDFWLVRNSWGPGWGEQGYFRMVRGKNMCGVADWASYPIVLKNK